MFKTEETRRIRSRHGKPGTRVHDVPVPHTRPMTTACGKRVRLFDARDRVYDLPLSASDDIPVTCPACVRAVAEHTQTPPSEGDQVT
jgi:hypothetical protein